jgi:hypothetical protein
VQEKQASIMLAMFIPGGWGSRQQLITGTAAAVAAIGHGHRQGPCGCSGRWLTQLVGILSARRLWHEGSDKHMWHVTHAAWLHWPCELPGTIVTRAGCLS